MRDRLRPFRPLPPPDPITRRKPKANVNRQNVATPIGVCVCLCGKIKEKVGKWVCPYRWRVLIFLLHAASNTHIHTCELRFAGILSRGALYCHRPPSEIPRRGKVKKEKDHRWKSGAMLPKETTPRFKNNLPRKDRKAKQTERR